MMKQTICLLLILIMASVLEAQIVVDGTKDAAYPAAVAVQSIETGFGDNLSEWNAAYCAIDSGKLFLMFTGNLEANFNKLEVFIDSTAGGFNMYPSMPGNDGSGVMAGMTFDTGFDPDYHLIFRRGTGPGPKFDVDMGILGSGTFSSHIDIFGGSTTGAGNTPTGPANASPIMVGYDNSNTAGIGGNAGSMADQMAALAVNTGLEIGIDLADIGNPTGPIRVMLLQNNQGHDFLSNQTLGGLPVGTGNLGANPGTINFNNFAGDQFFTHVPEPAAIAACLLGVGLLFRAHRKRT
jgi:hypothetical protein